MRVAAMVSRVRGRGRRTRRDEGRGQSSQADEWNVKINFFESGSELQNNENECFGESELKGRKHDTKWF